jgi:hypothetical protein
VGCRDVDAEGTATCDTCHDAFGRPGPCP